jgi:hypothetical protein
MGTEYHACYVYNKTRFPHVSESTTIHIMAGRMSGLLSLIVGNQMSYALCGRRASRQIDVFEPSEATCRECKRRWELATGQRPLRQTR